MKAKRLGASTYVSSGNPTPETMAKIAAIRDRWLQPPALVPTAELLREVRIGRNTVIRQLGKRPLDWVDPNNPKDLDGKAHLTADEMREYVRAKCREAGSIKAFADQHRLSSAFVSELLNGIREPGRQLPESLGFERMIVYCRRLSGGKSRR